MGAALGFLSMSVDAWNEPLQEAILSTSLRLSRCDH